MAQENLPDAQFQRYDDEISLFDLWLILRRRFWWMVAIMVTVVAVAIAWLLITPAVYDYRASASVGVMPDGQPIESDATVLSRMNNIIIPNQRRQKIEELGAAGRSLKIKASLEGRVLGLTGQGTEGQGPHLMDMMTKALDALVAAHMNRLEPARQALADSMSRLEKDTERVLSPNSGELSEGAAQLLAQISTQRAELEQKLRAAENTRVIAEPSRVLESTDPSMSVILALAVVLGGMLAVFGAFMVEFVTRANEYARRQGASSRK